MLHVSIAAEPLFNIGPLVVTNALLTSWLSLGVLALLAWLGSRSVKLVPEKSSQMIWEMAVEFFEDLTASIAGSEKAKRFFPLGMTLFIAILFMNWTGLIPGVGTIGINRPAEVASEISGWEEEMGKVAETDKVMPIPQDAETGLAKEEQELTEFVPLFRAGTADLNTTLALALVTMILVQYYAINYTGLKGYLGKFFNFSGPIDFFVGILELISELAKIISFAFRLFGNIFAGEVLLMVMLFLIPVVIPVPFLAMELFVGLIQAFVFAMLALVFLAIATEETHH